MPVITDTVRKSTSLHRPPGPPSDGIYGSSSGIPFWPGIKFYFISCIR